LLAIDFWSLFFGGTPMHRFALAFSATLFGFAAVPLSAISPASVQIGQELFEREWRTRSPALGSDGLGPLFNAASCVACHNQGGLGGGGAAEFNAKTVGIEQMQIAGGVVTDDSLTALVQTFHPGFLLPSGSLINTCSITHHGGSPAYASVRSRLLEELPVRFSDAGGPADAAEVRRANAYQILFQNKLGKLSVNIKARLYQRNTTALFGAGLLDQVSDKLIRQQMLAQQKHPEISGRPATLRSGGYGKFGWRGNLPSLLLFTDQACANEVGLKTDRRQQPIDPMNPNYRNKMSDVSDNQVRAIRDFIASLPAPVQKIPEDSFERMQVQRGAQVFSAIGCAVCHVPTLGPAVGAYTDLLLHEMGCELMDLNHAEPYIVRKTMVSTPGVSLTENVRGTMTSSTQMVGAYYGPATEITAPGGSLSFDSADVNFSQSNAWRNGDVTRQTQNRTSRQRVDRTNRRLAGFFFQAPEFPFRELIVEDRGEVEFGPIATDSQQRSSVNVGQVGVDSSGRPSARRINGSFDVETTYSATADLSRRLHFERTKFNEEWRTPPLWGVADSAPYMHDGRAETLLEAIVLHGGESEKTRDRFLMSSKNDRDALIKFLGTLVAPQVPMPKNF
jgi:CxxC motif-containing protein (DUF1111 family)